MVASRTVRWVGELPSEAEIQVHRLYQSPRPADAVQPPRPAEDPAYTPPTTMAEIEARLECAMERDRAYEVTLRPPQQATESLSSPIEIMLGEVTEFLP
jgi:hypothetical protein